MPRSLRFRRDGTFTIVQFTDLHWRNGDDLDARTRSLVAAVLDAERPDLVVLTGDVIEGDCDDPATAWRQAVEPIERRAIPWAAVFGNHDDDGSLGRAELMAVQQSCPMCLSEAGPAELAGVGNYALSVQSSNGGAAAAVLYFLDSGRYAPDGRGCYAWIQPEQIEWFRVTARSFELLPALVFFHIPIPEYDLAWRQGGGHGSMGEPVCCPEFNSGLFDALCDAGNVLGVFVGHDHLNDFDAPLRGIRLCYGRATGFNSYGQDGFARGARVIQLREGRREFATRVVSAAAATDQFE